DRGRFPVRIGRDFEDHALDHDSTREGGWRWFVAPDLHERHRKHAGAGADASDRQLGLETARSERLPDEPEWIGDRLIDNIENARAVSEEAERGESRPDGG